MVTVRWEVVGLGSLPRVSEAEEDDGSVVVLVVFVQKTMFSPQAISVYVQDGQRNTIDSEKMGNIARMLGVLGSEELAGEIGKLKYIPSREK